MHEAFLQQGESGHGDDPSDCLRILAAGGNENSRQEIREKDQGKHLSIEN